MRKTHLFTEENMPKPHNVIGESMTVFGEGDMDKQFEVHIQRGKKDGGPPPHCHPWDEGFYILKGRVELTLEGESKIFSKGSFVHIPAGKIHSYKNVTDGATMIAIVGDPRGGLFFAGLDNISLSDPEFMPKFLNIADQYDVEFKI